MSNGLVMKYFVLNPNKQDAYGAASRAAMRAYAEGIDAENHDLALDLIEWCARIERENDEPIIPILG